MAVFSLKSGELRHREKLLESPTPEEEAEKLGVELERIESTEALREHLMDHYREKGISDLQTVDALTRKALGHFRDALEDREQRIIYDELEE